MPTNLKEIQRLTMVNEKDVLLKVLHQKGADRTSLLLYVPLPKGYVLQESRIQTIPKFKRIPLYVKRKAILVLNDDKNTKKQTRDKIRKIVQDAGLNNDTRLRTTTVELLVFPDANASEKTWYYRYLFSGSNQKVNVRIAAGHGVKKINFKNNDIFIDYKE